MLRNSLAMSSTVSGFFPPEPMPGNPFHSFENGFTPWDCTELFASAPVSPKPDEPNRSNQNPTNSNSGSHDPNRPVSVNDERKRRRMISNRESARRSRMRKQKHLENLRNQLNRLRIENRELMNQLHFVLYHCQSVRMDNNRLRSEHSMLRKRLSNIRQILMLRQLQQQQFTSAWP